MLLIIGKQSDILLQIDDKRNVAKLCALSRTTYSYCKQCVDEFIKEGLVIKTSVCVQLTKKGKTVQLLLFQLKAELKC